MTLFSKNFQIILSDDFPLISLQRKYHFEIKKNHKQGFDLLHDICFEGQNKPSFIELFAGKKEQQQLHSALVSPVHLHISPNGLALAKVLKLSNEASIPFFERLKNEFGLHIEINDGCPFWLCQSSLNHLGLTATEQTVFSYLNQIVNDLHDDQKLNEIQMFIRQDEIYETSKQLTGQHINSLWFWGTNEQKNTKNDKKKYELKSSKTFGKNDYFQALEKNFEVENDSILLSKISNILDKRVLIRLIPLRRLMLLSKRKTRIESSR